MEEDAGRKIEAKLDVIIRLLAAPLVQGKKQAESVQALAALGLERTDIAAICNTSPDAVRARLSEARRGRQRRPTEKEAE
jgi:DNA-directed RNA polymerase specialized sigma24 family protein